MDLGEKGDASPLPTGGDPEAHAQQPLADDARRMEKINQLKKAVADGNYQVNPEEVARKLIEHMREPKE